MALFEGKNDEKHQKFLKIIISLAVYFFMYMP